MYLVETQVSDETQVGERGGEVGADLDAVGHGVGKGGGEGGGGVGVEEAERLCADREQRRRREVSDRRHARWDRYS